MPRFCRWLLPAAAMGAIVVSAAPPAPRPPAGSLSPFGEPTVLATGTSPYFVAVADLNHDGAPDLATSNTVSHTVTVFLNHGNGTFAAGVSYPTRGFTPYALALGDLNGDGAPDIVCGNMFSVTFSVFFNKGDGTFEEARTVPSEPGPMFPVIADLDGDGIPDIAFCNIGHDDISVYGNDGAGHFTHKGTFPSKGVVPYSLIAADFDGDGHMDLATGNIYSANVSVLRGTGAFTFAEAVTYKTDSLTQILYAADLNGDGHPDIVSGNGGSDNISVLMNRGDGTFLSAVNYPVKLPQGVAVADLNGDGYPDIATANQSANSASVLLNHGDGTFAPAVDLLVQGLYPTGVALADLNHDGRPDLITANSGSHNISIFLNGLVKPKVLETTVTSGGAVGAREQRLLAPIVVRMNVAIDPATVTAQAAQLFGSQSGPHPVDVIASERTIELRPRDGARFQAGEDVTVQLSNLMRSRDGLAPHTGFAGRFVVQPQGGSGLFAARDRTTADRPIAALVPADVNADGRLDLIAVPRDGGALTVFENHGAPFATPSTVAIGAHRVGDLQTADINGDGRIDLIAADQLAPRLLVAFGSGGGRFSAPVEIALPDVARSIAVADFDGDGSPDIAALGATAEVTLVLNAGEGRFKEPLVAPLDARGAALRAADVTRDGIPDLLVLSWTHDAVAVYRGSGDGTFLKKDTIPIRTVAGGDDWLLRDMNQDGAPDLVTVDRRGSELSIRQNDGAGGFGKPRRIPLPQPVRGVAIADVDGSGTQDIVVLGDAGVSVLVAKERGVIAPSPHVSAIGRASAFVIGDYDVDGAVDVVLLNVDALTLTLATNGQSARPGPTSTASEDTAAAASVRRPVRRPGGR